MAQARISAAIARIQQALDRLENRETDASSPGAMAELESRHAQLKTAATATVRQIDGLLGELERNHG